jgi:alanyl-tRNA synthetase
MNMAATEKLYFSDSSLLQFQANVIQVETADGQDKVLLDRTAFYPTGGGQPFDTGKLDDVEVIDVVEEEDGRIYHLVNHTGAFKVGQNVAGTVDRLRRLDHLQQHSGQHILSQAFIQAADAETHSFHLGAQSSTIDIGMSTPTDDAMRAAEEVANLVIFENRPMRVHLVDETGAAALPLRKESAVSGTIRVIEVEDFDWSPCGGTHAKQTGQIGLIAIKSYERVKGNLTRVEFVCGHRALEDYRLAHKSAVTTAQLFSAARDNAPPLVEKAIQENRSLKRRIKDLLDLATTAEAQQLLEQTPEIQRIKIVKAIFDNRDVEEIRFLATKLAAVDSVIALLATREGSGARLVFARSANLTQNMGKLLTETCQMTGGRGGGKPEMAQGGAADLTKLEEAMNAAFSKAIS